MLDDRRAYLLGRAWQALADTEQRTDRPLHTVLRFKADHQEMRSTEMAQALTAQLGREVTAEWVRKYLERARNAFAAALLAELRAMLPDPTPDVVQQELIDLKLLQYCEKALEAWRKDGGQRTV